MPFSPPSGFYTPQLPRTRFTSHFQPFATLSPLVSRQWKTPYPQTEHPVPVVPSLPPPPPPVTSAVPGSSAPAMAGFMLGRGAGGMSPYAIMRSGLIPGIRSAGTDIRTGVNTAAALIKRVTPGGYTGSNDPG